jgi:DNA invertase Pin-like site-specific DNA recombinase
MIFGYMRVSTQDKQTFERQEITLKQYAATNKFEFDNIIQEKISGTIKAISRPEYSKLKDKLRKNDILIITDLDRLGRNADDVIRELKELKELGIKVIALDTPYMNEWQKANDDSMYNMIIDLLITLKAHLAEQERNKTVSRINQGLDAAREKGIKLGRPKAELPEDFVKKYEKYKSGEYGNLSALGFAKSLGIGRATLYKYINIYNKQG